MKRSSGKRDETPSRPLTFRAAEDLGPFELAQLRADRTAWPLDERTQYDKLSELAVMSALGKWLRQSRSDRWYQWTLRQRDFIVGGQPGITAEEYDTVARRFAVIGVR
jgi:hypothetical protein